MTNQQLIQLKQVISVLDESVVKLDAKNKIQKDLFAEYIRIFHKLSQKLALLSNKINQQILIEEGSINENISNIFQHLSNSLLRMADCSRNVAIKAKNQVFDPMKLFYENYNNLNQEQLKRMKILQTELHEKNQDINKYRQSYLTASDRLQKHKKTHNKVMARIQSGDSTELEKYNNTIKKMIENIKNCKQNYQGAVTHINERYGDIRKQIQEITRSLCHNQQSRVSFSKKSVISSIRILQDFTSFYDNGVQKKIEDSSKMSDQDKSIGYLNKNLQLKLRLLSASTYKEQFVSYEQIAKQKRKKSLFEQNPHLSQIFTQVKQIDRQIMIKIITPWFISSENIEELPSMNMDEEAIDECKRKILQFQPYSYYFIEEVYQKVNEMSSFYCKLSDQNFLFILNTFQTITNNLDFQSNTNNSSLSAQFLYKMAQISNRIMWKKNGVSNKKQPIQLLCHHFGQKTSKLKNQTVLKKLFLYLQKKRSLKKQVTQQQNKSMMNAFTKNLYAVMNRKKQVQLNDQELFICLQQLTHIMANLQVPTDASIPFLKSLLGKSQNSRSFDYLKTILLENKDRQERQKIFYRTQIKEKKQKQMKKAIQDKRMAQYCIMLVAKNGFFTKEQLQLRLLSKSLQNIHKQILIRLTEIPDNKWIHLIPLDKKIDYIGMKQQVAQNSVPTHIQQIITLDVNRSLHNHGEYLNPTILHSLLRTYAYYHKDISYCQGMNYIAGYLYIKTRDEQSAYRIFQYLMETRFKELFANQFEVLKIKMYQFERLLSIFFPEISEHFKKQAITPECYIVSWIITLFASSYQYTMESYLIDLLWERFIVWGWAQFFKFVLALFSDFKQQLIQLTYDRALHFLGQMGRSKMFLANKKTYMEEYADRKIDQNIDSYPISAQLLQNLKEQYKLD